MGSHSVVLAYMPSMGKSHAAAVASGIRTSFRGVQFVLVVGVCGGAPKTTDGTSILLGDVIISTMVMQYDFGRRYPNKSTMRQESEGNLSYPNPEIRSFIEKASGNVSHARISEKTLSYVRELCQQPRFAACRSPAIGKDLPFPPDYRHKHQILGLYAKCDSCRSEADDVCSDALKTSCTDLGCDDTRRLPNSKGPESKDPSVHFGAFASGDSVIKSAFHRDEIIHGYKVIAFEMEGAGVWNVIPTIIVKSVCDFADIHKAKIWQEHAAMNAAACTKALLDEWTSSTNPVEVSVSLDIKQEVKLKFMRSLGFSSIDARKHDTRPPHRKTCECLFSTKEFMQWSKRIDFARHRGFLWIKGKPGAGKSTLMKHAVHYSRLYNSDHITAAYFFNARGDVLEKSRLGMLRSLLYQLIDQNSELYSWVEHAYLDKRKKHGSNIDWRDGELSELLRYIVEHGQSRPMIIFIDALDECEEFEMRGLVSLLKDLNAIAITAKVKLNICLSSRHYPTISMKERLELIMDEEPEHEHDISKYISDQLVFEDDYIKVELARKAQGVFLWVVLVVELLNRAFDEGMVDAVQIKLREIPGEIGEIFRLILKKDNPRIGETVLILQWVLSATRPLLKMELYWAVRAGTSSASLGLWNPQKTPMDSVERYITATSKGLIEIRGDHVQFIHETVAEFLQQSNILQILDSTLVPSIEVASHERLARCCLVYLVSVAPQVETDPGYPFLKYASSKLLNHVPGNISWLTQLLLLYRRPALLVDKLPKHSRAILTTRAWYSPYGSGISLLYSLVRYSNNIIMGTYLSGLSIRLEDLDNSETLEAGFKFIPEDMMNLYITKTISSVDYLPFLMNTYTTKAAVFLLKHGPESRLPVVCRLLLLLTVAVRVSTKVSGLLMLVCLLVLVFFGAIFLI